MARLGDICYKITDGSHNPPNGISDSEFWMLSSKNIYDDYITYDDPLYLSRENFEIENKRTQIKSGDILLTIVGTVGRVAVVPENANNICLQRSVAVIKPNTDIVLPRFLMYQIQSMKNVLEKEAKGVAQKGIYLQQVENLPVKIFEYDVQKKIVCDLDKVSNLISLRKQQLSKLDELVKSRFIEVFGDPETNPYGYPTKKLSDVASYWNGLTYKPEDVQDQGTIVLRSSNIQNSQLDFEDTVRVTCKIREKQYVQNNDILMCSRNGSAKLVGKVALITNISEPMSFGAFMMIIRSDYYRYLMTYFQMDAFRNQIKTGATTTINQITGTMLNQVILPVPDLSVVSQFATFVEQIDKSKFEIQQSLEKLETLKKALMQKYFG